MEQDALVADAGVQVLDQQRATGPGHIRFGQQAGLETRRPRLQAPDVGEMRLAGAGRGHDHGGRLRPVGPSVDEIGGGLVGPADEEILRLQRRAVREIEDELVGRGSHGLSLAAGIAPPSATAALLPL